MGDIKITKKDVMWGYIGQFFQIGSGIITLPLVLRLLTPDEVGMNYLMLTISTMVASKTNGHRSSGGYYHES